MHKCVKLRRTYCTLEYFCSYKLLITLEYLMSVRRKQVCLNSQNQLNLYIFDKLILLSSNGLHVFSLVR